MFGFGKREYITDAQAEPKANPDMEAEVDALTEERDELRESIRVLRCELSDLRSNFREAQNTYNEDTQSMRDNFVKQEDDFRKKLYDMATRCAADTAKYEHEFHSTREAKGIELATLETRIAMLKSQESEMLNGITLNENAWKKVIESREREMKSILDNKDRDFLIVLSSKDAEIERQHRIIMELSRHIGSIAVPNYSSAPVGAQGPQIGNTNCGPQNRVRH